MPRCLLIYPEFPPSYWGGQYALEFVNRKAALPPLGLITLAGLFPESYELRLVDMNVEPITDEMLEWAEYAFISAMAVQHKSFHEVADLCRSRGIRTIGGGPYPTSFHEQIHNVDHLVQGEVEECFGEFLALLERGEAPAIFHAGCDEEEGHIKRPNVAHAPIPRYDLLKIGEYVSMALQFSRGCPYNCEFCDITKLFGRRMRTKSNTQILAELDALYAQNWRGPVFFVDDNFIGNRKSVTSLLPDVLEWQRERNFPFTFFTEASVNLAELPEMMELMTEAGFNMVFLGIETPDPSVLLQTNKGHNVKQGNPEYLSWAVRTLQQAGLEVSSGFIVGFDGDTERCFQSQFDFIQKTGIPSAMVGMLNAFKGTDLYDRLAAEGRLLDESMGDNTAVSLNFVPKMDPTVLVNGYKTLLSKLYDPTLKNYFERCYTLVKHWNMKPQSQRGFPDYAVRAISMSFFKQTFSRQGKAYLKFMLRVLCTRPRLMAEAFRLAIIGYHYERITRHQIMIDDFRKLLATEHHSIKEMISLAAARGGVKVTEMQGRLQESLTRISSFYTQIHEDFRSTADTAMKSFQASVESYLSQLSEPFRFEFPARN